DAGPHHTGDRAPPGDGGESRCHRRARSRQAGGGGPPRGIAAQLTSVRALGGVAVQQCRAGAAIGGGEVVFGFSTDLKEVEGTPPEPSATGMSLKSYMDVLAACSGGEVLPPPAPKSSTFSEAKREISRQPY